MKKMILLVLLVALILCGCGDERYEKVNFDIATTLPIEEVEQMPDFELTFGPKGKFTEDGVFFAVNDEDSPTDTLYFADSVTDVIYPLCAQTNCSHDTDGCPARMEVSNLHYDGEFLYFVEGSAFLGECIMRQRVDGSDREILFRQEAEEYGVATIHSTLYHGDILYFTTFGGVFDSETGELTSGERVCIGNLKTGELKIIPMEFGEGDGATTGILGVCGNELLMIRQTGGDGIFGEQTYRERFFLLNLDTYEITIIAEFTLQNRRAYRMIGDSILYFELNWPDAELLMEDETEGGLKITTCDVMIVDLKNRKAYLKKDVVLTTQMFSDEYYIYYEWNENYTSFIKMVKDLRTGEVRPYPENIPRLIWPVRAGEYLYAEMKDEKGEWSYVRILEKDFWAGNPDFFVFPEWAMTGIVF